MGRAIRLILPVAEALGFSHSSGIIHRDVKPANILISRTGVIKLTDFGIAAIRESTATSHIAFSLLYTAPETFDERRDPNNDEPIDPRAERSDLYSLAATLYVLGTGRPPFQSTSSAGLMAQILTQPTPPTGHAHLDRFFATAMAKDPTQRHPTAGKFIEELLAINRSNTATIVAALDDLHLSAADNNAEDALPADSNPATIASHNIALDTLPIPTSHNETPGQHSVTPSGRRLNNRDVPEQPPASLSPTLRAHQPTPWWRSTRRWAMIVGTILLISLLLYLLPASRTGLSLLSENAPSTTALGGVKRIENQSSDADRLIQDLVDHDGVVIQLNHQILGKPGPGDVTVEYACDQSTGCSSVRIQDNQVTFDPIEGGVWFKGCYRVIVDGSGYGAQSLDLEMTFRGATCPN